MSPEDITSEIERIETAIDELEAERDDLIWQLEGMSDGCPIRS